MGAFGKFKVLGRPRTHVARSPLALEAVAAVAALAAAEAVMVLAAAAAVAAVAAAAMAAMSCFRFLVGGSRQF